MGPGCGCVLLLLFACTALSAQAFESAHFECIDMRALAVMMAEIITSYMLTVPRVYIAGQTSYMMEAAIKFIEPLCAPLACLLRSGFTNTGGTGGRLTAYDMLVLLNSMEVLTDCSRTVLKRDKLTDDRTAFRLPPRPPQTIITLPGSDCNYAV